MKQDKIFVTSYNRFRMGCKHALWDEDVKDVNEAVPRYGKLYTLHTIIGYAEFNELKIKLGAKKWFG